MGANRRWQWELLVGESVVEERRGAVRDSRFIHFKLHRAGKEQVLRTLLGRPSLVH